MYETVGTCQFCGEPPMLDLASGNEVIFYGCCQSAQDLLPDWGPEYIWGETLEAMVGEWCLEGPPAHVLYDFDHDDTVASWHLEVEDIDREMAHDFIDEHHRHHNAPLGEVFRLGCFNGHTLVGVATVGRPVSRMLQQRHPDMLEVTRVCSEGDDRLRRNVCSKLYAAACKEAKRRGYRVLITYTLESEMGTTLKASGWTEEARGCGGGSWNREARPREDKAPTSKKVRWRRVVNPKLAPVVPKGCQAALFA